MTMTKKTKKSYWKCICECGNEIIVEKTQLRSGKTKSCGCYRDELSRQRSIDRELSKKGYDWKKENPDEAYDGYINAKLSKNNTSGTKGVSWDNSRMKWIAHISINKKHVGLGRYEKLEDAIKARKAAEVKYWGMEVRQ